MIEIGIETSILEDILSGKKTIECRLGKQKFLKIRPGDVLSIREDTWKGDKILRSIPNRAEIKVTQILYFETFTEAFASIDFKEAIPSAASPSEAVEAYRKFYTSEDEKKYGVVAIYFELLQF